MLDMSNMDIPESNYSKKTNLTLGISKKEHMIICTCFSIAKHFKTTGIRSWLLGIEDITFNTHTSTKCKLRHKIILRMKVYANMEDYLEQNNSLQ